MTSRDGAPGRTVTVEDLVGQWAWLVGRVEDGYREDVDEYTHDLCCRDRLHHRWLIATDHALVRWTPPVRALDTHFAAATVFDDGIALSHYVRVNSRDAHDLWWWRRHPRLLVGELGRALRSTGVVD